jgi:predicted dehydrogenase
MKIAIVGCGNIAEPYITDMMSYPNIELIGLTDVSLEVASQLAEKHKLACFDSLEAILASEAEIIVNLTPHFAHKEINEAALNAGKHVFSEKPLALNPDEAWALVALAKEKGLRLASAPFVSVGEAQQTAWKYIHEGRLGKVRVVYAEANWGGIERWHPAPQSFYQVGAWVDLGVYLLHQITSFLAPVRSVRAFGKLLMPQHVTKTGESFEVTTPDWMLTLLELEDGTQVRITSSYYVQIQGSLQKGLEFHGDKGALAIDSLQQFHAKVSFAPMGEKHQPVELIRPPYQGIPWGRGVYHVVSAIEAGQPHPFTGEHAAHIVDVLDAARRSIDTAEAIAVTSSFPSPMTAYWADSV